MTAWQAELRDQIVARLGDEAHVRTYGSMATPNLIDSWSDLDLRLDLPGTVDIVDLLAPAEVWAFEDVTARDGDQVVRMILNDGRRLDLHVEGPGRVSMSPPTDDNAVRFLAGMAAVKIGQKDQLIGLHLTLEVLRHCLEQAMLIRDRDTQTVVHRRGIGLDERAVEVAELASRSLAVVPRPNTIERAAELYGRWRVDLDAGYRPDWSGLRRVIDRGLRVTRTRQPRPCVLPDR